MTEAFGTQFLAIALHQFLRSFSFDLMSLLRCALLLLCLAFAGCQSGNQGTGDEQKEPYFLAGKRRLQERDMQGAIDYFEKALDANPHSASAHIELGILYEQQQNDWPSALYHYSRALQIRPDYPSADVIKQRIHSCKTELAKTVVQLPSVEALQRRLDAVVAENQQLRQQLQAWQDYYAGRATTMISNLPAPAVASNVTPRNIGPAAPTQVVARLPHTENTSAHAPAATGSARSYTVASGDTFEKIARRQGVKVSTLMSANPTIDARKLRPGQTLAVPSASP